MNAGEGVDNGQETRDMIGAEEELLAVYAAIEFEPAHPVSDDEIAELSRRNPALRFERTPQGALIVSPPTGFGTGIRNTELTKQLANWNERTQLGWVTDSSSGYSLPTKALYAPDAAWISKARAGSITSEHQDEFAPMSPDVVFELRSKSDSPMRLLRKLRQYIDAGSTLAVMIDPYQRKVTVLFAGEEPRTFENPESMTFASKNGIEPLPGFTLDLQSIFVL